MLRFRTRRAIATNLPHTSGLDLGTGGAAGADREADKPREVFTNAVATQSDEETQEEKSQRRSVGLVLPDLKSRMLRPDAPAFVFNNHSQCLSHYYTLLDGTMVAFYPPGVYLSWLRNTVNTAGPAIARSNQLILAKLKSAEDKLDDILLGQRVSMGAVTDALKAFHEPLRQALSQASSHLEVAAEDVITRMISQQQQQGEKDAGGGGGVACSGRDDAAGAVADLQPFDDLLAAWGSFERALEKVCERLQESKAAKERPYEVGQFKVDKAVALLRGEYACGALTLYSLGRLIMAPNPLNSVLAFLSGAGWWLLGDKRRKLEESLAEIERLDHITLRLKELGLAVMGKAEELRQVANWGHRCPGEEVVEYAEGWREEVMQWRYDRGVMLQWSRDLREGLQEAR